MTEPLTTNARRPRKRFLATRSGMILVGIVIGMLARYTLGSPDGDRELEQGFRAPITETSPLYDLPVKGAGQKDSDGPDASLPGSSGSESALVPPIKIPGMMTFPNSGSGSDSTQIAFSPDQADAFTHDSSAAFHAHGEEVCASGCAASNHPTEELTEAHFRKLLVELEYEPMNRTNNALEALLFFGPQTKAMLLEHGYGELDSERAKFLWEELAVTHARISIRVVDQHGEIRTWIQPTRVPFDRRHVFKMETENLQPLVTSGTVKRVGLDHLWTRL